MKTCQQCGKVLPPESTHVCAPWASPDNRSPDAASSHQAAERIVTEHARQLVERIEAGEAPMVPPPSGWLTRPPHEAPWQADDQEAWFGEAVAQRSRAVAAEAMVAGRDSQMAALRQLAEEAITTVHQSCGAVCGCVGTACRNTNRLRARLAEIGGGE